MLTVSCAYTNDIDNDCTALIEISQRAKCVTAVAVKTCGQKFLGVGKTLRLPPTFSLILLSLFYFPLHLIFTSFTNGAARFVIVSLELSLRST